MNAGFKRITAFIIGIVIMAAGIAGCSGDAGNDTFDAGSIRTYRDIPGITDEEIDAIEALKSRSQSFSYGALLTTESFILPDGAYAGFQALFCELLSGLFGIPFVQEFVEWDELLNGLNDFTIDFTGGLNTAQGRARNLFITAPVAERSLSVFVKKGGANIQTADDLNGLNVGFSIRAITAQSVKNAYPLLEFKTVYVENADAAAKLLSGEIDAYVIDSVTAIDFLDHDYIIGLEIFPRAFTPVPLAAANPELEPVISAVNKYLAAGGDEITNGLYRTGSREYAAFELFHKLTDREKRYIADLTARNQRVPVVMEYDHYPISFFNNNDREFQGIAWDILTEISLLTGIEFEIINGRDAPWHVIFAMLTSGEASMISDLTPTEERIGRYLWASEPYFISRYAFISRLDHSQLEFYQIPMVRTGVSRGTAYEEMYRSWLSSDTRLFLYDSQDNAFNALENNEIDLILGSENTLMFQTIFKEKPGYKINISVDTVSVGSYFGFNKDQEVLRSIISKAQGYVDTGRIALNWTSRVYDHARITARQQTLYVLIIACILSVMLITLIIFTIRTNRIRALYKNQYTTLSAIYDALPDLLFCTDINHKFTSSNRGYEEFLGVSKSELLGKNVNEIDGLSDRLPENYMEVNQKVFDEKTTVRAHEWLTSSDGSRRYFETIKTPLIQDGKMTGLLGIRRDITELKEALDNLEYELIKHKLTRDALDFGLWEVVDVDSETGNPFGKVVWSDEVRRILGFKNKEDFPDDISAWSGRLHPDDKDRVLYSFTSSVADRTGSIPFDTEYRLMAKNGKYKHIHAFGATLRDKFGAPVRVAGGLKDITDKMKLEAELEAALKAEKDAVRELYYANERTSLMLDATPLICNMWSIDHKVIDCNEEALKLFEISKKEYMERFLALSPEFQPDGQRTADKGREMLEKAFAEGRCVFEWMNKKDDGTLIPMEVTLTRVAYGDSYVAVGYGRDLRRRNQLMDEVRYQNSLLETLNSVSSTLLEPDISQFENSLFAVMGMLTKAVDADRAFIWKNMVKDGRLHCALIYEWPENAKLRQLNENTLYRPYNDIFPNWGQALPQGKCINNIVRKMSPREQANFSPQGILSLLAVPVFLQDKFWGFVGFDDCPTNACLRRARN
ncbi:MAG: transporter substrate-binding domain-containing protein [Defluviitaleaceae bacterium]|nr:transporter substrate-binding domain-containing protein [Defluviitaleaceae bacterium]